MRYVRTATVNISSGADMPLRKTDHVRICADEQTYRIEDDSDDFAAVRLVPNAMPEVNFSDIDTGVDFLGFGLALPLMISPMSGGTKVNKDFNRIIATIAQQCRVACGLGSMRVLFRHPELEAQFAIKRIAADVPVVGNIGSVQLREHSPDAIIRLCDKLKVDALSVHLNCGQELFQQDGDRDFVGARAALEALVRSSPYPIIVKETGFGIAPREIRALIDCGVRQIDVAGSGGSNWIRVEAYRQQQNAHGYPSADLFSDWGLSTAKILVALRDASWARESTVIASGGIRNAMHIAKSIALGASMTSMALPFVRMIINHGMERAIAFVHQLTLDLSTIMLMCGADSIAALRRSALTIGSELTHVARQLNDG